MILQTHHPHPWHCWFLTVWCGWDGMQRTGKGTGRESNKERDKQTDRGTYSFRKRTNLYCLFSEWDSIVTNMYAHMPVYRQWDNCTGLQEDSIPIVYNHSLKYTSHRHTHTQRHACTHTIQKMTINKITTSMYKDKGTSHCYEEHTWPHSKQLRAAAGKELSRKAQPMCILW